MKLLFRVFGRFMQAYEAFCVERLKKQFRACGAGVEIGPRVAIWGAPDMSVGDRVSIHDYTFIFASGGVSIGDGTAISCHCSISSVTHPIPWTDRSEDIHRAVSIGRNVWIGMGAIILPGVTIADHAIIGAGSVVTKDVGSGVVVAGAPARTIRSFAVERSRGGLDPGRHDAMLRDRLSLLPEGSL